MTATRILLVEDERAYRELLERQLARRGHTVHACARAEDALEAPEADVLICDISLPGMSGLDLLRRLKERCPTLEAIVLTGRGSVATAVEAMGLGAYHYFEKPVKLAELDLYVRGAAEKRRLAEENRDLREQLARGPRPPAFVGSSLAVKKVREWIARAAGAPAPVLIEGETGTGKDLVARAIHEASPRKDGPFVAINCGALSETLLENELFGHVAGAFTGASKEQRGLFEVADGGTLFIDEVAEMSLEIQKKFLRVLENGEFRRLGEARVRTADVRVVAATNRVLKERVASGGFREDLYYRLNVLSVRTPPLREHLEDLPLLVEELLEQARARHGRAFRVEPAVLERFSRYDWPGNVRELKNVLERAMVLAPGNTIGLAQCPGLGEEPSGAGPSGPPSGAGEGADVASERLEDIEREHIRRVLEACAGNKTLAARRLGLSLRSLYRRLERLGIK
ncbi:MAG: sigma-54-dependent Fis family transcriptional regulator [Planctomycetota bacterium]|nr:MAG: sigma-54-dependent Fis family transcriptional regulator [Planctomycetota bacterium]